MEIGFSNSIESGNSGEKSGDFPELYFEILFLSKEYQEKIILEFNCLSCFPECYLLARKDTLRFLHRCSYR